MCSKLPSKINLSTTRVSFAFRQKQKEMTKGGKISDCTTTTTTTTTLARARDLIENCWLLFLLEFKFRETYSLFQMFLKIHKKKQNKSLKHM